MEFELQHLEGPVTLVALQGRLDANGAGAIAQRLTAALAEAGHDVAVDLSGVSFMGSMGMRLLVANARALHPRGRRLVLFDAPELVQQALQDAGLDLLMPCLADRRTALAQLAQGAR